MTRVLVVDDEALDAGAADYVTKPFGMAEMLARLRAVVRRAPDGAPEVTQVATEAFQLDLVGHRAFVGTAPTETEVRLTPTEWGMVEHLVRFPGRLITYRQMVTAVWGPTYDPDPNLLRVHMAHIRHKLERDPSMPVHFITDSGLGYRFENDK